MEQGRTEDTEHGNKYRFWGQLCKVVVVWHPPKPFFLNKQGRKQQTVGVFHAYSGGL